MTYQQEFNKQIKHSMQWYRQNYPNHIIVFSMKSQNCQNDLISSLQQPRALYPKDAPLQLLYDKIQCETQDFMRSKDSHSIDQDIFIKEFYLYGKTKYIKDHQSSTQKYEIVPLDMNFQQAYQIYGRKNVLAILYSDKSPEQSPKKNSISNKQKWFMRLLIVITLFLIIIMLFQKNDTAYQTQKVLENRVKQIHDRKTKTYSTFQPQIMYDLESLYLKDLQEEVEFVNKKFLDEAM